MSRPQVESDQQQRAVVLCLPQVQREARAIPIGPFPTVGVDAARKRAREIVGEMVRGIDPRAAKQAAHDAATFGELAIDYIDLHAKPRKKSWQGDQRQIDTYLAGWCSRPLADIRREHVATLHAKLGRENGPYTANRALALISTLFAFANGSTGGKARTLRKVSDASGKKNAHGSFNPPSSRHSSRPWTRNHRKRFATSSTFHS